jgi:2-oxoisovalerate dehydrogenase E1 component alpha subunit
MSVTTSRVADFSIDYLQFIDEGSQPTQALPAFADEQTLLDLYRRMALVRKLDNKAINLQRTGKLGTYPACTGQEAVGVGTGSAMRATDVFAPYYRDQAVMMQRGVKMHDIYAVWGGFESGNSPETAVNKHDFPTCVPIATQYLHAAGVAYAMKLKGESNAVVTTGGEGSTSQGDFYEAINVAGAQSLPMVFVINNNQWAISVPRDQQTNTQTIAQKAIAAEISALQVDGNDVVAVRYAVEQALEKARSGGGATLIEAVTYRLCDHTTADDFSRYADDQLKPAWKREPITRLALYMKNQGYWSQDQETQLQDELSKEVEAAVDTYSKLPTPKATDMFDDLYAELPAAFESQYQELKGE